ncbi:MAG: hypothetical protein HXS54_17595 [Theionarchaea archaeon]|nr:hypothetical protein [Theionarchaea archaeon]
MLDWSRIDNYYIFQRLVNHLFAQECNSPGFIPSSPYIGADGSWDGYYNGYYDYEKEEGSWSIQSKWTKKSGKYAFQYLRGKIKKELQKAEARNVDHLRIATNAELNADYINELESLNNGEVTTLRVWDREELERRIELQPYLRYRFFGFPQYPKFVPSREYFSKVEKNLIPVSSREISVFNSYIREAELFILSESQHLLLIHSPGGYGKSHLLREIAQIAYQTDRQRQIWMIWPGRREMSDAFQDEIVEGRKYLLILDDADRYLEELEPLLSFVRSNGDSVKVILALRTSGFQSIYEKIRKLRLEEYYYETKISEWSEDDLIKLLRLAAGKEEIDDEETIARFCPNPYLIVQIGRIVKKDPTVDFRKIKEKIANEIYHEAKMCLGDTFSPTELESFLTILTCLVPFSRNDRIFKFLNAKFNGRIEEVIDNLVKVGILRIIGNSYRFNPDMKGDLYLACHLEDAEPEQRERLIQELLQISPEKLFINLEAAAQHSMSESIRGPLSRIIRSWIESARNTPTYQKAKRMNLVEKIAYIVPEYALNLLNVYLDTDDSLATDDYGPAIRKLMRMPSLRREVIKIIEEIGTKGMPGHYDNYKPSSLIRDSVSPLYNSTHAILETLNIFPDWLQLPSSSRIALISAGLTEVLAASHDYTKPTIRGLTFGVKTPGDTPEICNVRNRALQILKMMIIHPSLEVKLAAVNIMNGIGRGNLGDMSEGEIPLSQRIATERKEVLEEVGQLISPEAEFRLLSAVEDLLLNWWIWKRPGTDAAKDYLLIFPHSPEYLAFRFFASPDYVVEDFSSEESQAPAGDRWRWFSDNPIRRSYSLNPGDFRKLVDSLRSTYCTEIQIVVFLKELEKEISLCNPWAHPPIVTCWVELESELFISIRNNDVLWNEIPDRFRGEIDIAMADLNESFVTELACEVLSELPDTPISKVETFLIVLQKHSIPEPLLNSWLLELLERGNPGTRIMVVHRLSFILKKSNNFDLFLGLLHVAISKEQVLRSTMIRYLSLTLDNFREQFSTAEGKTVECFRKELLCKLKDAPILNWHAERLLTLVLEDIDSVIDFVEYRLRKIREIRAGKIDDQEYEAIPFNGIECIKEQIKSFEDYEKLLDSIVRWYEEDWYGRNFELKYLMKSVDSLLNDQTGKMYLEEYIIKQLGMHNQDNAIRMARFLPFREDTIPVFIRVGEESITAGKADNIRKLLYSRRFLSPISSKPDEAPPALVSLKNLFQMLDQESEVIELKMIIEECIEAIDKEIEEFLEHGEELLNPRLGH